MALVKDFLRAIDSAWKPIGAEPINLQMIGSAALMLQCKYERGTKDGDVLETKEISPEIKERLESTAGKESEIFKQFRMYIEVVRTSLLLVPQKLEFHRIHDPKLKHFTIEALDITDVVVSKLKRFNNNDQDDIRAMIRLKLLDHRKLITRFNSAVDNFSMDARAEDMPKYIDHLHEIERDQFGVPESEIDLPDWMDR